MPFLPRTRALDVPALIRQEIARLTSTRLGVLALIALMCVPLLYGGLYLWANKDPQGSMDHLAVAIVDEDQGVARDDGTVARHGAEIAQKLVDGRAFGWEQVDGAAARRGVENGAYAFAVILPAAFSEDLESISTDSPRQARIELRTNDANNAIATTAGQRAMEALRAAIAEETGDTASLRLLDGLADVRDGLGRASDGSAQIADGEQQAIDGVDQLADGAARLGDGAVELSDGAGRLRDGAGQLSDGADTAASGASQLADGLAQLDAGAAQLPEQTRALADGARQVADGNAQIAGTADQAAAASQALADDVPTLRAEMRARLEAQGLDAATIDTVMASLDPIGERIASANGTVQGKIDEIDRLADGAGQVADGAERLAEAAPQLSGGIGDAADGASQLADGTAQLADGAQQLEDGASQLADGASQLADGASQLGDGLSTLRTGLVELKGGAETLSSELASGRDGIPASTEQLRARQAGTIADPVRVDEVSTAKADTYGAGLAPFFSTLAAWIGIYALFLIVKPFSRRAATAMWSPVRVAIAGWATPALLGALQMTMVYLILTGPLGYRMSHPLATWGLMLLASATFAAIILALNVWLGSVGQFLGLVLMVIQLVGAGGTFPWQTLPAPLDSLHHLLPMSWSVAALRQAMLGGNMALAGGMAAMLAALLVAGLAAATAGIARVTSTRVMRDLAPSLIG